STWQLEDSTVELAGQQSVDCAGFYGGTCSSDATRITPDFRARGSAHYRSGPLTVGLTMNMIGDLELAENAFPNENGTLDATYYWDMNAIYIFNDQIELFAGIQNLADEQPPVIGFRAGGDSNTNIPLFDPLGRRYF